MKHIIKPSKLIIENFRNYKDVSFYLGEKLTVISGQNGVGKSNLLSLIAAGSGVNKTSMMGSNFQPEFNDFFNIDKDEDYENYKIYTQYSDENGDVAFTKRLSFKDDTADQRGIRIIPRTTNYYDKVKTLSETEASVKKNYGVGGAARVRIPTIFMSVSRLYPLGEQRDSVKVKSVNKRNLLYQKKADEKFQEWYNMVIPDAIKSGAELTLIKKDACSRASLSMDMENTPTLSQSIGQDNIGNIISALVDIFLLSMEDDYTGALLCIDEIDVSLHPDTQIRLLDLFDKLSDELSIQFVVTTHSLVILQECLKKQRENGKDYKVVYIKDKCAPYITENKTYELLEADLYDSLTFTSPKVKVYFEDEIGKELFTLLLKSFVDIYKKVNNQGDKPALRNSSKITNYKDINLKIKELSEMAGVDDKIKLINCKLGCEELLNIKEADNYFKRVIFVLDGDARLKGSDQKPNICDYLHERYDPKRFHLNVRKHTPNVCFFPDYFAPESYFYKIIYTLYSNAIENREFWRALDQYEETTLYTSDKMRDLFDDLQGSYTNDDIKSVFGSFDDSNVWNFIINSNLLTYYYSDYITVQELISFISKFRDAFNMTYSLTISNKYT